MCAGDSSGSAVEYKEEEEVGTVRPGAGGTSCGTLTAAVREDGRLEMGPENSPEPSDWPGGSSLLPEVRQGGTWAFSEVGDAWVAPQPLCPLVAVALLLCGSFWNARCRK